jgi:DeoR family transcriptional regulator of aga operon
VANGDGVWQDLADDGELRGSVTTALQPDVIPAQRRAAVLAHVRRTGAASIRELARAIGASESTIRRDLEQLQAAGYLQRAHGGALLPRPPRATFEPEAAFAAGIARAEKRAIGAAAAAALNAGEAVIFDSSSTVREAAQAVAARRIALTAVTNDLETGRVLAAAPEIRVVVPGGTVRPGSLTLVGEPGVTFLAGVHADVALIGVHAITGRTLSETALETAAMKRAMIAAARRVVVLADAGKFQPAAFCTICDVTAVQELITDGAADPAALAALRELGVKVTVA